MVDAVEENDFDKGETGEQNVQSDFKTENFEWNMENYSEKVTSIE